MRTQMIVSRAPGEFGEVSQLMVDVDLKGKLIGDREIWLAVVLNLQ